MYHVVGMTLDNDDKGDQLISVMSTEYWMCLKAANLKAHVNSQAKCSFKELLGETKTITICYASWSPANINRTIPD
jgi:hypothetical protein